MIYGDSNWVRPEFKQPFAGAKAWGKTCGIRFAQPHSQKAKAMKIFAAPFFAWFELLVITVGDNIITISNNHDTNKRYLYACNSGSALRHYSSSLSGITSFSSRFGAWFFISC